MGVTICLGKTLYGFDVWAPREKPQAFGRLSGEAPGSMHSRELSFPTSPLAGENIMMGDENRCNDLFLDDTRTGTKTDRRSQAWGQAES